MRCKQMMEWTNEYLDGTLTDELKQEVEHHLNSCSHCARYLEEMQQVLKLLSAIGEEELPPGFEQRLHHRLRQAGRKTEAGLTRGRPWTSGQWVKWGTVLAVVSMLVFSVYLIKPFGFIKYDKNGNNLSAQDSPAEESSDYKMHSSDGDTAMYEFEQPESSPEAARENAPIASSEADTADEILRAAEAPAEILLYVSKDGYIGEDIQEEIVFIAADSGMNILEQQQNQFILQVTEEGLSDKFFERLSRLGRVESSGLNRGEITITIQVIIE
jgi:hypothetical protein